MKREVSVGIFAVLIVAAALLTVYYLNIGPTGQVIIGEYTDEESCVAANYTWENTTEEECTNQTIVTNQTVDCEPCLEYEDINGTQGECISWSSCVEETSSEEEVCEDVVTGGQCVGDVCSAESVEFCEDETSCEAEGGYWYGDVCNEGEEQVTVSVTEPSDGYESGEDIPLTFTTTGNDISCSYEITSDNGTFMTEGELSGCASTTFDLSNYDEDENYIAIVYVTGPTGNASDSSAEFWIDTPGAETSEEEEEIEEVPVEPVVPQVQSITQISAGAVGGQDIIQGSSRALSVSVQNTGTEPVSSCALSSDSGWVAVTEAAKGISPGTSAAFSFSINVPEETTIGASTLGLTVACAETSASSSVAVNVLEKKLDFNITDVQRTRDDRVRVLYVITELSGEDQEVEIFFSITDASGVEVGNASQNRSIDANETDDFRTNIPINETLLPVNETTGEPLEVDLTLSASFNSQIYSSSVLEPISLGAPLGGFAIFEGVGGGSIILLVVVLVVLGAIFFIARKLRKSRRSD